MQASNPNKSDKWLCLFSHWVKPVDGQRKHYIGQRTPRKCRFCGRDETMATFRSDAHIIPAAFGNRSLLSYEECDDCNQQIGSRLEDDLAN